MGKYQGYEKYKKYEIEWLGTIPEHWEFGRIKFIGHIKYGLGEPPEKLDNGLPIIRATDIYRGVIDGSNVQRVNPDKVPWSRNPELKTGDILVVRSGAYTGDSAIVTDEWAGSIAGYDMVLTPIQAHPKYIAWNFLSRHVLEGQLHLAKSRAAQPHLNAEELGNTVIAIPPLDEQESIAYFLDRKTTQIDALIAKKAALLEKLDEKRTALISHAVTKGLDRNVPMKDSGVEWLGNIPEHWEVKRLSFLAKRIGDGIHSTPEYVDNSEYHFINGNNLMNGKITINDSTKCVSKEEFNKYNLNLDRQTLLLSINGTIGNVAFYNNEPVMLGKSAAYIILNSDVEISFAYYCMLSQNTKNYFFNEVTGTTIFNLSLKSIKNTFFTHSSLEEQKAIARYLERKTAEIDRQKAKVKEAIDLLKEYRTALITNAVTGKIDVRQVARV